MKDVVRLSGAEKDTDIIKDAGTGAVYVLDVPQTQLRLGNYIQNLHDWGVKNKMLSRLRICSNIPLGGQVRFDAPELDGPQYPQDMMSLLNLLDPEQMGAITIVNDDRTLLAAVMQQLIYVGYPLTHVSVALAREARDQMRTERFIAHLDALLASSQDAASRLDSLEQVWQQDPGFEDADRQELTAVHEKNRDAYAQISEELKKARNQEIKVAVAASKKSGKSTIVNSMIGTELAPTSLERPTPNTCVYRKSPDGQYHLVYDDKHLTFPDKEGIARELREEFERARAGADGENTLPDMEIGYVSNKNNFESYTIFDTPGPDLAGAAGHSEAAHRAIEECDVALFAIDFTKQLQTTEEEYLREVKAVFDAHGKIHTFIFTVNKMDQAFKQTKETNSPVKTIDWIRSRLEDIDPGYASCVIFATSAQDYFDTLQLRELAAGTPEIAPLLEEDANWCDTTPIVLDDLTEGDAEDDVMALVTNVHNETQNLRYQLGMRYVDEEVMQDFSGMPQLMKYIAYMAQSKARDEILNDITYTVASLVSQIGDVSRELQNIRAMMDVSQGQIDRITEVLGRYVQDVSQILVPGDLTAFDERYIPIGSPLRTLLGDDTPPVSLDMLIQRVGDKIRGRCRPEEVADRLWEPFKTAVIDKLKSMRWVKFDKGAAAVTLSDEQLEPVNAALEAYIQPIRDWAQTAAERVAASLQNVLEVRADEVNKRTEDCKLELAREDVVLQFPEDPAFQVSLQLPPLSAIGSTLKTVRLDQQLSRVTEDLWVPQQFFRNIIEGRPIDHSEVQIRDLSRSHFGRILDDYRASFEETLRSAGVFQMIDAHLARTADSVTSALREVLQRFGDITKRRLQRIEAFQHVVDDRDQYRDRLAVLERKEKVIAEITGAAQDFTAVWEQVAPSKEAG